VKVRVIDGNIRIASLLLVTTFVELRVVAGRSRTRAGRPHAVSGRSTLVQIYHAVFMPRCAMALRDRFQNGMVVSWQGNGMACVNQTRPSCVNQTGNTQSKPLAERHGMCGLTFTMVVEVMIDMRSAERACNEGINLLSQYLRHLVTGSACGLCALLAG
jgi:hypothetical protein